MHPDINTVMILAIAALNALTAFMSYRTKSALTAVAENVAIVEKATNSMKDALVKATGQAAHAAGKEEARTEIEARAAVLAEGKLIGTPQGS